VRSARPATCHVDVSNLMGRFRAAPDLITDSYQHSLLTERMIGARTLAADLGGRRTSDNLSSSVNVYSGVGAKTVREIWVTDVGMY